MTTLIIGDANADLSATLSRFPHEGDDSPVQSLLWGSGGSAANTAVGLARLAGQVRLLARVGLDPAAKIALQAAQTAGVDLQYMQFDQHQATGLCYTAISPNGERTFFAFRGANVALEFQQSALEGITALHISGHALMEGRQRTTTLALIELAHSKQLPISIDLCQPLLRVWRTDLLQLLPTVQTLFANEFELRLLATGDHHGPTSPAALAQLAVELQMHGSRLIIGKCGAAGCVIADAEQLYTIPGFSVHVVDTTGCGDAFAAGFLLAQAHGATPPEAAIIGNACGALAATHTGATEALPNRSELQQFIQEQYQTIESNWLRRFLAEDRYDTPK